MKKKVPRRRIDVNIEELDRIIDGAKTAPLSESDSEKLKTALHALAERLLPRSKTEKTSSVFDDLNSAAPHARLNGKKLGRPVTAGLHGGQARKLYRAGISKSEIAAGLQIGRTSVRRILA